MLKSTTRSAVLLAVFATGMGAVPAFAFLGVLNGPGAFQVSGTWTTTATDAAFTWDIVQDTSGFYYYNYRLVIPEGAAPVDSFLIEIAPTLTAADFWGTTGHVVVGDFTPAEYPNMPRAIHGIALLDISGNRASFDYKSYAAPVWGDFYVMSDETTPSTAFNTGFTNPDSDPPDPPSDGTITFHLLRPGPSAPIPDASTILPACFGVLQLLAIRKKVFR
jgi:hypothetical protein